MGSVLSATFLFFVDNLGITWTRSRTLQLYLLATCSEYECLLFSLLTPDRSAFQLPRNVCLLALNAIKKSESFIKFEYQNILPFCLHYSSLRESSASVFIVAGAADAVSLKSILLL